MKTIRVSISGMSCGHCLNAVNKALAGVRGVTPVSVQMGSAQVDFDEQIVDASGILAAIRTAGYEAVEVP